MAGAYLWLHFTLHASTANTDQAHHTSSDLSLQNGAEAENTITCYIEAHFSTPPKSLKISDPISGKVITRISDLTDNEWSDEINLTIGQSVELNVQATWAEDDVVDSTQQNFIQLVLSPDQMEDSTMTLRNAGDIDTTATFQLRQ